MREIKFRVWNGKRMLFMGRGGYCDFEIAGGEIFVCGTFDFVKKDFPLMQFTGLQDKFKKDLYEADILDVRYGSHGKVVVKFENGKYNVSGYNLQKCFLVGNIHENPELV